MITKEIATQLNYRNELHHKTLTNSDKTPTRCRVNGTCKTWKTRPNDFRLPVKHGLRDCFYITPENADEWSLSNDDSTWEEQSQDNQDLAQFGNY